MSITAIDFFCGMGGSSTGLASAGITVKLAANHWARAIETHSANHPDTEHLCADIQAVDLRYLPRTDIMWASPICTEISPAGGRRKRGHQLDLFEDHGHVPTEAFERTRVTFWEVLRAAELFRHKIILVENVVEAAAWELFDTWLAGLTALGYHVQFVSVSAAHVGGDGNPHAPQWRDRLYIVASRHDVPRPDVDPRPIAWCEKCGCDVPAMQWWKRDGRRIGKYGSQYTYVCPEGDHGQVEPYVAPAATAIDWTNLGTRIGDRARPLAPATMRRVQSGLDMLRSGAFSFTMAHGGRRAPIDVTAEPMGTHTTAQSEALVLAAAGNTYDAASRGTDGYLRAWPADGSPVPVQTATGTLGLALPPLVMGGQGEQKARPIDEPMRSQRASGADFLLSPFVMSVNHDGSGRHFDPAARPMPTETVKRGEALVVPDGAFVAMLRANGRPRDTSEPLPTFSTGRNHGLVIPFRRGAKPYRADNGPLSTMTTRNQHGVMQPAIDINDCHFRMLTPREAANAQAFPRSYTILGNAGEQQMQAGNAVAVNVAAWLGAASVEALGGAA